jgi:hypothetical protein
LKSKHIAVYEKTNELVVNFLGLGEANRSALESLDARSQVEVLALDVLGALFSHLVLEVPQVALVAAPRVGVVPTDLETRQEYFQGHERLVTAFAESKGEQSTLPLRFSIAHHSQRWFCLLPT